MLRRVLVVRDGVLRPTFPKLPAPMAFSTEDGSSEEQNSGGRTLGDMAEKARSTAEEFVRQAKEKSDELGDKAKEAFQETREAVMGESQEEKNEFKSKVERGEYNHD